MIRINVCIIVIIIILLLWLSWRIDSKLTDKCDIQDESLMLY